MRSTCIATQLRAGHAENALPQSAVATINCRAMPGTEVELIRRRLVALVNDKEISVTQAHETITGDPSPLHLILEDVEVVSRSMWPDVIVVPTMSTGATDGLFLRNAGIPTYGVSGIFSKPGGGGAHGGDERIGIKQFYEAQEFLYRLVQRLAK